MSIFIGRAQPSGSPLWIPESSFRTHWHLIGGTGFGKTTVIELLIHSLLLNLNTSAHFIFDRLGGFSQSLLLWFASPYCPVWIRDRVVYIDAAREDFVPTFNPLVYDTPAHGYFKTQRAGEVILRAWASQNIEEMPRLARWVFNAMWAAAQLGLTVADCVHLLMPGSQYHGPILGRLPEQLAAEWSEIMQARGGEASRILESSRNRLKPFFENPILRSMFGSTQNRLDILRFMTEGRIVVINLAPQNRLSSQLADAIGGMILNEILALARSRPVHERSAVYLWLDEFQRFVGPDIEEALPEVRQLAVRLILSHQSMSQLERNGVDLRPMIWQAQSRMILGLQGEDADLLGHELAALTYEPLRVKDEMFTRRQLVKDQRVIQLASWTEAEQEAENWQQTYGSNWNTQTSSTSSQGRTQSDSSSASVATRFGNPNDLRTSGSSRQTGESATQTKGTTRGDGGSETNGRGGSRSRSKSKSCGESILPVYETFSELSRRSYYSFDEQAALWAQRIRLLKTGQAILRVVNDPAIHQVNVQRHAPGYLAWDLATIERRLPEVFEELHALIAKNYASDVFTTPDAVTRETQQRLDRVLRPKLVLRTESTAITTDVANPLL